MMQKKTNVGHGNLDQFLIEGANEALAFQQSLLKPDSNGITIAQKLALAMANIINGELSGVIETKAETILAGITGVYHHSLPVLDLMESFRGKWRGKWGNMVVQHNWDIIRRYNPINTPLINMNYYMSASQYAWVGDGFGWNIEMTNTQRKEVKLLLGSVYHLNKDQQVDYHVPHVGVAGGTGIIAWIVPNRIFFETTVLDQDKYIIAEYRWWIANNQVQLESGNFVAYSKSENTP